MSGLLPPRTSSTRASDNSTYTSYGSYTDVSSKYSSAYTQSRVSGDDVRSLMSDMSDMSNLTSVSRNHLSKRQRERGSRGSPTRSVTSSVMTGSTTNTINRTHSSKNSGNPNESFCSDFGRVFEEGVLPICIDQGVVGASKRHIGWKCSLLALDYGYHLPMFLTGLVETDPPYSFLSFEGSIDMILVGGSQNRLLTHVDKIIPALKLGLQSGHRNSVSKAVYCFLLLLICDEANPYNGAMARAITPYLRRLLPTLSLYINDTHKIGTEGAYQVEERSLGGLVEEVLETCERRGGPGVGKIVKYCVPTYQSVLK